ncbi:2-(1,2-epoxy-1,2-dihydrophenyl)acetyl-CoA isomerase [Kordiimonas sediminis]|uniref:2-(1,2-epoxy-1,2-dihydrophenyl)acetyl-CoA isomerase n=1 Tax=Kordiimonas sediminis TaxID=1735581 RepID=A0A919AL00_9PROT|nr:enoyl-CoA hydratase-related protein [Kordiimonas sediminis]GHF10965.1 2-(1,2-epoxy-1,2-dihydrophenyl)acetyl-CoA isomerase [Kordiimonas sediminis]
MTYETILFRVENGVAWVSLNRPDRLNAINDQMLKELTSVLDETESNDAIRCLVLTGEGRAFCPGQDLNDRNVSGGERPDLGETVGNGYNPFLRRFYNLSVPTIAAVNGVAAGAGANIALACDIVIAADTAKFIQVYSNIGLIPDAGGSFILPRLIGMAKAKELTFTARPVKADEAESMGMIARCVAADDLIATVKEMAEGFAVKPTFGLANTKKALHASYSNDLDTQLDMERDLMQKCGFSDDYSEGVSAFLEKRTPVFKGR